MHGWRNALNIAAQDCAAHKRLKIFFAGFLSDVPPETALRESPLPVRMERKGDYWAGRVSASQGHRSAPIEFGIFGSDAKAWALFSLTETNWAEMELLRLLRSLSPTFSPAFLSSRDIRGLFQRIEDEEGAEVSINKAVAYSYRREGQISFKKEIYHDVFNRAEHEGMFVDKVDFSVESHEPGFLHAFVARNGTAKFIGGSLELFLARILSGVMNTSARKHEVFQQAARRPGELAVSAVDLDFGRTIFRARTDSLRFLSSLDGMSRSGIAVMHQNPYLHVALVDFYDGSSFDIFATTPTAISIIPQAGASGFSLNRLCNHIFENFREGTIRRPEPRKWELTDVLS